LARGVCPTAHLKRCAVVLPRQAHLFSRLITRPRQLFRSTVIRPRPSAFAVTLVGPRKQRVAGSVHAPLADQATWCARGLVDSDDLAVGEDGPRGQELRVVQDVERDDERCSHDGVPTREINSVRVVEK
jgi:hypothetical protein